MSVSHNFGKQAEALVVDFLKQATYEILETNWRFSHLEVDIIAKKDDFIVFVEVKARHRKNSAFDEIISIKKQKNIISAAEKFLEINDLENELRFDVAFVFKQNNKLIIDYIENAFYGMIE
jgi:putative endonuclease